MKPIVTIIIPVRNEAGLIEKTLDELRIVKTPHTIFVVSDVVDSTDKTEEVVENYAKTHTNIRLLPAAHVISHGFAAALYRGVRYVRTPYTVFVMADLCDDPKTIDSMYEKSRSGWDIVCASRYMAKGKRLGGPFIQGVFSKLVNWYMRMFTGVPTRDVSNSFKLYKSDILQKLVFDTHMGSEISLSLLMTAYRDGVKITEVPTVWHGRTQGEAKFRFMRQIRGYFTACLHALVG